MLVYYTNSMDDVFEWLDCLTRKRVELMRSIMSDNPSSIRDLAGTLNRDVKNVWDDLRRLAELDLIGFQSTGRVKRPIVKRQIIITTIRVDEL